ncbi:RICIN domain-containing protein, partial [Streptomyces sp. URMC 124]
NVPAAQPVHKKTPAPLASTPPADKQRGLVYDGLKPAPKGDRCVGVYSVSRAGLCTHGPDAPPKGVDITKDTPPVAAKAAAPSSLTGDGGQAPSATEALGGAPSVVDARKGGVAAAAAAPSPDGSTTPQAGSGSKVVCEGDGSAGNRVQVLYVHAPGRDRFGQ